MNAGSVHFAALGIARTLLAGSREQHALHARLVECVDAPAEWMHGLAERLGQWPAHRWQQHSIGSLAAWLAHDAHFLQAWEVMRGPRIRRYILRPWAQMHPRPLGLDGLLLPPWPAPGDLAAWLQLTPQALWRLSLPEGWQRRRPLHEQHYRFIPSPKRSGGWRLLEAPEPHLKALQRRVLDGALAQVPVHQAVHGYVPGRSVVTHAQQHVGRAVVVRFDLQDFFASVTASRVHATWRTLGYPAPVARVLTALCTVATPEPVLERLRGLGALTWRQAQRLRDAHLPQGAPTSPALANLCAFSLDLRLAGLAEAFGAGYSRYADDLVFSGDASLARQAARLQLQVARAALDEGFALQHRKTQVLRAGRRQQVCGIVVNRHTNLPRAEFDRLKAMLHRALTRGLDHVDAPGGGEVSEYLRGRVAWAMQLNPAKASVLRELLQRLDVPAVPQERASS
ncbi:reverse transcriptase family protein [Schlegelella sp. S2-27]|uniref:RNA-directed DNA polymerase n=1 Tax=Caldimonas mangrovi TaxID=2944811 RepID=A0ABT0YSQ2_9BURK|nr:reverse transcriptase family protein [Caldimonas mangrovi]MCM5681773.1 reverse transcriptase family protein [Caldimonas mangrovi]